MRIVSKDSGYRLEQLREHLFLRDHAMEIINYSFSKVFQPKKHIPSNDVIVFTSTYNPSMYFNSRIIKDCVKNVRNDGMKKAFSSCKIIMGSRQPKSLRKMLISSKFSSNG